MIHGVISFSGWQNAQLYVFCTLCGLWERAWTSNTGVTFTELPLSSAPAQLPAASSSAGFPSPSSFSSPTGRPSSEPCSPRPFHPPGSGRKQSQSHYCKKLTFYWYRTTNKKKHLKPSRLNGILAIAWGQGLFKWLRSDIIYLQSVCCFQYRLVSIDFISCEPPFVHPWSIYSTPLQYISTAVPELFTRAPLSWPTSKPRLQQLTSIVQTAWGDHIFLRQQALLTAHYLMLSTKMAIHGSRVFAFSKNKSSFSLCAVRPHSLNQKPTLKKKPWHIFWS